MLYQKLLVGENPFKLEVGDSFCYRLHRHREIELSYCMAGEYRILIDNRMYCLHAGDLMVINPMAAHEFPGEDPGFGSRMTGRMIKNFQLLPWAMCWAARWRKFGNAGPVNARPLQIALRNCPAWRGRIAPIPICQPAASES